MARPHHADRPSFRHTPTALRRLLDAAPPPVTAGPALASDDFPALFAAAPAALLVLRSDAPAFTIVAATDAYLRATLQTRDTLVGRPVFDALPDANPGNDAPTGVANLRASLETVLCTGAPHAMAVQRYDLRRPDGTWEERYWAPRNAPVVGPDGAVRYLVHSVEDVTERVRAEHERARLLAEVAAERDRLEYVFRHSPYFLSVVRGPDHVMTLQNDAYYAMVGHRDLTGRPLAEAIPELEAQGFIALLDRVLATGEPFVGRELPAVLARTPGAPPEERFVDFSYLPLVEADGRRTGVIAHGADVTDHVHARREVERLLAESERARAESERARAEAQAANRAKGEFLATMSHELRTPLNAIAGYTQLLELGVAGPTTPEQRDYLTRLTASGQHLLGLVNDVLDLAKVDAGQMTVAREPATTDAAVTAALDLVRPQGDARGVRVVDGTPAVSAPYVGDEHRVRQVLVNLLSNAIKFTEPGGSVTVTCGRAGDAPPSVHVHGAGPWAFVRVADTGIGIAPEAQAAVFEPFRQVEPGAGGVYTRTKGGTGLGLAISRRLARLMGGDITLESAPGAGSTFTLWLPSPGGPDRGEGGADETAAARSARALRATPGVVRGLGELGALLRWQVDTLVSAYAERLRADPGVPLARGMQQAELEDHMVTALADLAQTLVIVGEAGTAETGLLADSVAINRIVAERHAVRRFAQGWDLAALRRDFAVLREVLAGAVRADARAGGADAEAALGILLGLVEQSEARAVAAWQAARARDADGVAVDGASTT